MKTKKAWDLTEAQIAETRKRQRLETEKFQEDFIASLASRMEKKASLGDSEVEVEAFAVTDGSSCEK